jgi:hypothetical protein
VGQGELPSDLYRELVEGSVLQILEEEGWFSEARR